MDSRDRCLNSGIFVLCLSLFACGGGDDDGTSSDIASTTPIPISGAVVKGNVVDAVVDIYTQDGQTLIVGGITTDLNGEFSTKLPATTEFPVLVMSSGGSYTDEYTGQLVQLSTTDNLFAYATIGNYAAVNPFTNAMKVTVDMMVADGYAPDIKTAIDRARFQYTRMLGIDPTKIGQSALVTGNPIMQHIIPLGGFSKLVDDLNMHHSGSVPVFELITDMIHDLGNDGLLDGIGAPNDYTSMLSGGSGNLADAAAAYLTNLNQGFPPVEPVNISTINFDQTLFVVADIVGPGGSLVFTGPDASLVHGGTIFEAGNVIFSYSANNLEFSISTASEFQQDPLAAPPPRHDISIFQFITNGTTLTQVGINDNQTLTNYPLPPHPITGQVMFGPDFDSSASWTSQYSTGQFTSADDVPGLIFDFVNQRVIFNNVRLSRITNQIHIDGYIHPNISVIINGEISY